jgi:hypothetical protein
MDLALELKKRRREVLLGGALILVVSVFLYTRAGSSAAGADEDDSVFVTDSPKEVQGAVNKLASVKLPGVLLDKLEEEAVHYDPSQRNIFRYGNIPLPPPSPEELARIEEARRAAEVARQAAIEQENQRLLQAQEEAAKLAAQPPIDPATGLPEGVTPPPPPKPVPPTIPFRYSGYLGSERNKMAVLYTGEDMMMARKGDVVEKQFRVLDIGYDWIKIGYIDPQFADQSQKLRMGP